MGDSTMERPLLQLREEEQSPCWALLKIDRKELKEQMKIAVPMIIANVLQYSINLVSVMFAGHLGEEELAGASLANSWALVTGYVLMVNISFSFSFISTLLFFFEIA
eukprot:Gb_02019 [translate_table: standard]